MYRKVEDFLADWLKASDGTIKVLKALTDERLGQDIVEGHNTLGWIGWHLATAPGYFCGFLLGLNVEAAGSLDNVPTKANEIVQAFKKAAEDVKREVEQKITDASIVEEVDVHGTPSPRGAVLRTMIDHQTHHRGQMTVLLRQAGLTVPGVMGPTREEQGK